MNQIDDEIIDSDQHRFNIVKYEQIKKKGDKK